MSKPDAHAGEPAASRWVEPIALGAVLVGCVLLVCRTHWNSIWVDPEFTGWVVPIANRMAAGQMLYADGGHLPIPPLSFVVMRLVSGGNGIWLHESIANALMQATTLGILYRGLSSVLPRSPVPFLATMAATPVFFGLLKTILYDSMAQCVAAAAIVIGLRLLLRPGSRPVSARSLLGVALASALCLLTKQSTGAGLVGGYALVLLLLSPGDVAVRRRLALLYVAEVVLMAIAVSLAISPFVSLPGLVYDVFVTGTEPKGGPLHAAMALSTFAGEIFAIAVKWGLLAFAALGLLLAGSQSLEIGANGKPRSAPGLAVTATAAAALGLGGLFAATRWPAFLDVQKALWEYWFVPIAQPVVFYLSLMLTLLLAGLLYVRRETVSDPARVLAAFGLVSFSTAVGHTLSVEFFRWTYDNNPLIVFALASGFALLCELGARLRPGRLASLSIHVLVFAVVASMWIAPYLLMRELAPCTETWPEVRHLAGARLRKDASGMRTVVALVRQLAPDPTDAVLLLPEDPNVHAWFERPRPALLGAITFADQYWDRYVDRDFEELMRAPPKVIVIGPQLLWRPFHRIWKTDRGAERLIDRIQNELIPRRYRMVANPEIQHRLGTATPFGLDWIKRPDTMHVYLRQD